MPSPMNVVYAVTKVAGADLSAHAHKFVALDSNGRVVLATVANSSAVVAPLGVLMNTPQSLEAASVGYRGPALVIAASTIAPGALVTTNGSGLLTSAGSGDWVKGQNLGGYIQPDQHASVELCPPFRLMSAP